MNATVSPDLLAMPAEFAECHDMQRAAYVAHRNPDCGQRVADLRACIACWWKTVKP